MSAEISEKSVKTKLMEILEEELSALELKIEIGELNRNKSVSVQTVGDIEVGDEQDNVRSSCEKTVEVLLKAVDNENVTLTADNKAFDPPRATNDDMLTENNYVKKNFTERTLNYSSGFEVKHLQQNRNEENKSLDNEEPFVPPSDNLAEKIMRRVEFLFQDYNIFKNSYLLNQIRRNKKGFVSLKIIASLRKLRALTRDYRVVAYSLLKSNILEMNSEKTKIRRIEPIPKIESTRFGKTIMVFNIPPEILSNDSLKDFFGKFGTVVSAGLYEINSPESDAYHKRCLHFHRKISSKTYGIVEFENYEGVAAVFKDGDGHLPKENDLKVVPLLPQIYKKERRYLKFAEQYDPYPKREFNQFRRREDFRAVKHEDPVRNEETLKKANVESSNGVSGDKFRYEKDNTRSYSNRGYFRRPYRYRRAPPSFKNYAEGEINHYCANKNYRWDENRHLRMNNSMNIDMLYPKINSKNPGYAYAENGNQRR